MIGWRAKPQTTEEEKQKSFDDFDLRLGDLMRGERATLGKSLLDVQRELKIKATYIAAIENADISAFETPGFVAGFVRSYARYLGMDPDQAFQRFCREANFVPAHGMSSAAMPQRTAQARARSNFADPLANPNVAFLPKGESLWHKIEPGAVGSLAVLVALIGAIGYGGWSILQEVQRVQLAPVDEAPAVVVQIDPLHQPAPTSELAEAGQDDVMDRLYRPEALDVPVFASRNGPIAAIDPRHGGPVASDKTANGIDLALAEAMGPEVPGDLVQVTAQAMPGVQVLAVRPAWVRVTSADGTVLLEKILDSCETWAVPSLEEPAQIRAGNSGGVYFTVNGQTFGPAAPGSNVVKNVALSPEAITERFTVADLSKDKDLAGLMTADASGTQVLDLAANCPST